jgi:hypothetical protein
MRPQIKTFADYVEDQAKSEKLFTEKLGFKVSATFVVRLAAKRSAAV